MTLEANATEKRKLKHYEVIIKKSTTKIIIQYNVVFRDFFWTKYNLTSFKPWFLQGKCSCRGL